MTNKADPNKPGLIQLTVVRRSGLEDFWWRNFDELRREYGRFTRHLKSPERRHVLGEAIRGRIIEIDFVVRYLDFLLFIGLGVFLDFKAQIARMFAVKSIDNSADKSHSAPMSQRHAGPSRGLKEH